MRESNTGTTGYTQTQIRALKRYAELKRTSNDVFLPLFFVRSRWLVLMGGGGSGKSNFAARKVVERCVGEAGHRILVTRKYFNSLRLSCYALLCDEIQTYYPDCGAVMTVSPMRITFPNGSVILFAGLDDVEKLKSIHHITSVWVEEASECLERDVDQLNIRLRDESPYYKQIIVTFNPVSVTHWLKARFFDRTAGNVVTSRTTYRDNRFLPAEYGEELERYREIDPYYYAVYCLGEWGVLGRTVFSALAVSERLSALADEVPQTGIYSYVAEEGEKPRERRFIASSGEDAPVRIYVPYGKGRTYAVGADTAGTGSDRFAAQVIDCVTCEQCAVIHMRTGETEFLCQLWCLCADYGFPLLAVEANFSTYVINKLAEWRYPRQYVRRSEDTYTHRLKKSYGFLTTQRNRNDIIASLVALMEDGGYALIHDRATLEEMLTFVRSEEWRAEAEAGAHDDLIMALAIALRAKEQAHLPPAPDTRSRVRWSADMWEDYNSASAVDKEYLLEKWGIPEGM